MQYVWMYVAAAAAITIIIIIIIITINIIIIACRASAGTRPLSWYTPPLHTREGLQARHVRKNPNPKP